MRNPALFSTTAFRTMGVDDGEVFNKVSKGWIFILADNLDKGSGVSNIWQSYLYLSEPLGYDHRDYGRGQDMV